MFVTKNYNLSRNKDDKQKARRRVRHATLRTFCEIGRSCRPECNFAVEDGYEVPYI